MQVGRVTVLASPARQALAIGLAERAERVREWPGLGRLAPPPFVLILADDSLGMARLGRGRAPGWGAGLTLPGARTIVLRADLPDLGRTLEHELGHLVLRSTVRGPLPLWFDEGYAVLAAGEIGRLEGLELSLAVAIGPLPTLDQLNLMLRGPATSAELAYALAGSAVSELARRPSPGGLVPLLSHLASGSGWEDALYAATGMSEDRFEGSWRRSLRRRYGLVTWLAAGGIWGLMGLALGWIVWVRRVRDRPRRAALDQGWVIEEDGPSPPGDATGGTAIPVDLRPPRH